MVEIVERWVRDGRCDKRVVLFGSCTNKINKKFGITEATFYRLVNYRCGGRDRVKQGTVDFFDCVRYCLCHKTHCMAEGKDGKWDGSRTTFTEVGQYLLEILRKCGSGLIIPGDILPFLQQFRQLTARAVQLRQN